MITQNIDQHFQKVILLKCAILYDHFIFNINVFKVKQKNDIYLISCWGSPRKKRKSGWAKSNFQCEEILLIKFSISVFIKISDRHGNMR